VALTSLGVALQVQFQSVSGGAAASLAPAAVGLASFTAEYAFASRDSTTPGPRAESRDSTPPVPPPPPPSLDFSGVLYANFQYGGEAGPAKASNKFDVERAYLTFRIPAGDDFSVRVTTDLFQQTSPGSDSFYRGWVVRAKYAYLQYNYLRGSGWRAFARAGLLQTVFIEHDEQFWPRWISTSPTERAGYFSSADAGVSTSLSLPGKVGEVYATLTNGPGYTSREVDRFKDYAARVTLTPWGRRQSDFLRTLALSAWGYKGATASRFADGGAGQLGPVGDALRRDRWGVHAGVADPRFTFAAQYAVRTEETDTGSNTSAAPRAVGDSTGVLVSAYAIVRPFLIASRGSKIPLALLGRVDRVTANRRSGSRYNTVIAGLIWDLSKRASLSLDYQETVPVDGAPLLPAKRYFAHIVARY